MDQLRHQPAHGLDAERQRRHIEQQLDPRTSPPRMPACTAAPSATTSSGFSSVCGRVRNSLSTAERTSGMRVDPPTITDFVDLLDRDAGVLDAVPARAERAFDDRLDQAVE